MFKLRRLSLSCYLWVLLSPAASLAAEPLLWKFNVGDEHHYRMVQNMEMDMTMAAGQTVKSTMRQTIDMAWKVEKIDDEGVATILQEISRMQMNMQAQDQPEMAYDTDSDEAPTGFGAMIAPLFKAMTAAPIKTTMTTRGEILEVEIPESIEKALKGIPGAAMMGGMFSDDGMKKMIQKGSLILPEAKNFEIGYEWNQESELNMPPIGQMTIDTKYCYQGPREVKSENANTKLEIFSIDMNMEFGGQGQFQIDITGQDVNGEFRFDRELGRLDSSEIVQDMDMAITVGDQIITQKILQTMTFETVEKVEKKVEKKEKTTEKEAALK